MSASWKGKERVDGDGKRRSIGDGDGSREERRKSERARVIPCPRHCVFVQSSYPKRRRRQFSTVLPRQKRRMARATRRNRSDDLGFEQAAAAAVAVNAAQQEREKQRSVSRLLSPAFVPMRAIRHQRRAPNRSAGGAAYLEKE